MNLTLLLLWLADHKFTPLLPYPATQSRLPSPLKPQRYYIPSIKSHTHTFIAYSFISTYMYVVNIEQKFLSSTSFLEMNLMQAQMFQFHFTQVYIYEQHWILNFIEFINLKLKFYRPNLIYKLEIEKSGSISNFTNFSSSSVKMCGPKI